MSVVRSFYPEVRLAKHINKAGGVRVGQALDAAESNMAKIRGACLEAIDAKIEELQQSAMRADEDNGEFIYQRANEVFGEAGALGLADLSAAAHSLCCLMSTEIAPAPGAVLLHLNTMRALRRAELSGDQAARQAVLDGLHALVARSAKR